MAVLKVELLRRCVWLVVLLVHSTALTLSPCVDDGNVRVGEVERGKTSSFTCRGHQAGDTVQWYYLRDSGEEYSAGACRPLPNNDPNGCQRGLLSPTFTASRTSGTEGRMTVDPTQTNGENQVSQATLRCGQTLTGTDNACRMDLITPAVVSMCNVKFERVNNDDWQTTGHCDITSASSTRGRYRCHWYRMIGSSSEEERNTTNYTPSSGVCTINESMPTADGVYTYKVKVTPGEVRKQASFSGSNEIKTPIPPTMTGCSADDYIAENTAISCTCQTVNVGQPAGRLVWYRDGVPFTYGNYGDGSVTVSQNCTRADHDVTQFRCAIHWAKIIFGENRTIKVGYKPERLSFKLGSGSQTEVTVKENNTVLLTCEADGRPVANMTVVKQGGTEIRSGQSPLTFPLTASCTDTGTYLCSATNLFGEADTSASVKLYVRCSPQSVSTELPTLNFVSTPVSTQFDVVAFPALEDDFSFRFIGSRGKCRCSTEVPLEDIQLSAKCQRQSGLDNTFACAVTVHNVSSSEAEGVYSVRVSNDEGFQDYTFEVKVNDGIKMATVECPPNYAVAAIGLGVVLALMLIVIVVVLVIFWRRQWIVPWAYQADNSRDRTASKRESSGMDLYLEPIAEPATLDGERGPYDVLNSEDIGQRSVYSEITQQTGREGTATSDATAPYDVLNPADIGQRSVYSEISQHAGKAGVSVSGTRRKGSAHQNT